MSCLILNTSGAYTKLQLPLTACATSFGFVRWRMFSFGHLAFGMAIYRSKDVDRAAKGVQ